MGEEFKPREVEYTQQSAQEIEKEVVEASEKRAAERAGTYEPTDEEKTEAARIAEEARLAEEENNGKVEVDLSDDNVLSHINKQRGSDFKTIEEMLAKPAVREEETDEAILAFTKFRKETGRSIDDYVKLGRDYSKDDPDALLRSYQAIMTPGLSDEDIRFTLNEQFGHDEDDEDRDIKRKEIAKRTEVSKAIKYFNDQKEQYNAPLVSTAPIVPEDQRESYSAWEKSRLGKESEQKRQLAIKENFDKSTNNLFSDKFEGFKFKINEEEVTYKIENVGKVKADQSDARNFIGRHVDEDGMIKSGEAYHKAMFAANDPDGFAKHFYELGAANAIKNDTKKAKNIDMSIRNADGSQRKSGEFVAREVSSDGGGLKFSPPKWE